MSPQKRLDPFSSSSGDITLRHDPAKLRILSRVVYCADGRCQRERTVFCPQKNKRLDVNVCQSCVRFDTFGLDSSTGKVDHIRCWPHPMHGHDNPKDDCQSPPLLAIDVMTQDVICVSPDCDLERLKTIMKEHGIGGVPVVDEHKIPVGFVSKKDLLGERIERVVSSRSDPINIRTAGGYLEQVDPSETERLSRVLVADVMTRRVQTLPVSGTISQAAGVMAEQDIDRLPVVAPDGEVIGLISAQDILRWLGEAGGYGGLAGAAEQKKLRI